MSDSSFGPEGGIARFDGYHGRQEGGTNSGGLRYPSPFFDIGQTYLPTSIRQMLRWCRYYFLVNGLINTITTKQAEYPITEILVDEPDSDIRERWTFLIERVLRLRSFLIEVGLDYYCYGNAFVTIHWPFQKWLECTNCHHRVQIQHAVYKFRNMKYHLACGECSFTSEAKVLDINIKSLKGVRLIRWNPENVTIEHNEVTGDTAYFFEIPAVLRADIMMGKRHIVETIPDIYIRALRDSKTLRYTSDNLFHLKRPTIAEKDMGWGMPLILPVLKDTYYLQILRKGQEAIAQQHIVPLRLLFPQPGSGSADPYSTTNLGMWRKRIESEITKWRTDPNYIPILPLPIGNETIGGEGKALMLHQEMRAWSEQIIAGMGVPMELVYGGMQYSGSNVSMRVVENSFLSYRTELLILACDFILGRIADYIEVPRPHIHFKRFKMADDLQRCALIFQMNNAMKVSDTTLLNEMDLDIIEEEKHKSAELDKQLENQRKMQLAQASLQGEVQVITAKYQAKAQLEMQKAGIPPPGPGAAGGGAPGQEQQVPGGGAAPGTETQQPDQGDQAAPGLSPGVTAYPEQGGQAPTEGIPASMQSPLNMQSSQGGYNVLYLARRQATELQKMDDASRYVELMKLKTMSPQIYTLVLQLINSEQGSQADALDPLQMPMPEQRPPRRQVSAG